jgi:hypothetical protein
VRLRVDATLRQHESCSDLVQSVCREVLQHAGRFQYDGAERFRAWRFRAALNKILERKRSLAANKRDVQRQTPIAPEADFADLRMAMQSPSQMAVAGELASQMEQAFDLLRRTTAKSSRWRGSSGCRTRKWRDRWAAARVPCGCCGPARSLPTSPPWTAFVARAESTAHLR